MSVTRTFKPGEWVNYPAYGVGYIKTMEQLEISGLQQEFYVIEFQNPRLILRLPLAKALANGLRKMSNNGELKKALTILKQHSKKQTTLWNKRAAIYEQKLRSGDVVALAEVLRDLKQGRSDINPSYSERTLFEEAVSRFSRELSIIEKIDIDKAEQKVARLLKTSA